MKNGYFSWPRHMFRDFKIRNRHLNLRLVGKTMQLFRITNKMVRKEWKRAGEKKMLVRPQNFIIKCNPMEMRLNRLSCSTEKKIWIRNEGSKECIKFIVTLFLSFESDNNFYKVKKSGCYLWLSVNGAHWDIYDPRRQSSVTRCHHEIYYNQNERQT